ncbi:uncharacterized protein N7511_001085 [Penicillium nucicola]|uniref:uncharacterized protein n=1 Tax=Penicillium nucicola TaxID=1850975 RepID=UPI002545AEC4|nr:uncharacterized protein N7511_001085 [Penicillium nucicola]KAJ5776074.1 hypothetical protein N7511_001085 [Penicillium nucicola]
MGAAEQNRLGRSVPKLKGKSNWIAWSDRLFFILKDFNPRYRDILTGKFPCPQLPADQDLSEVNKEKQNALIAQWKADDLKVRAWLGSTLEDEPALHVKEIYASHEAYQKLEAQFSEKEVKSNARCWAEWTSLKYEKSEMTALEFVRKFQQSLAQLRMATSRSGLGPRQQLPQFLQAIGTPAFTDYLDKIELDYAGPDLMEIAIAAFLQFVESDGNPDLAVFAKGHRSATVDANKSAPSDNASLASTSSHFSSTKTNSCNARLSNANPKSSSSGSSKGKKRAAEGSGEKVARRPRLNEAGRNMLENAAASRSSNTSRSQQRASSPLFGPRSLDGGVRGVEDDEGLPPVIDESLLDSTARF